MKRDFVVFMSPGTFFSETSERPVESWDVEEAKKLACDIKERHGATPYGFYFVTRSRTSEDLDSKITAESGIYYLGGKVETLEEVKARATSADRILIDNMEINHWDRIITNTNSYKFTTHLNPDDVVLDWPT